jgi:hypothetical protein
MTTSTAEILDAAEAMHHAGYWLVAVVGKKPIARAWGIERWSWAKLEDVLRQNPGAGIGVCLGPGRAPDGGWLADLEGDGPEAEESRAKLFTGEVLDSIGWISTRGDHQLVRLDEARFRELAPRLEKYLRADKGGVKAVYKLPGVPGLEIRTGGFKPDGTVKQCQSIVPPTPGTDRQPRRWKDAEHLADAPDAFYAFLENVASDAGRPRGGLLDIVCTGTDAEQRAIAYLHKVDPAISGQRGHDRTFYAACKIGPGFNLHPEAAFRVLRDHYNPRCEPSWSEAELRHKVNDAYANEERRGWLLNRHAKHADNGAAGNSARRKSGFQQASDPPPNGHADEESEQPESDERSSPPFAILSPRELVEANPRLREPIIDGLVRRGEIMNFVAPPKVGKSWLVLNLALSFAAGRPWLGRFTPSCGRVLLIDNELHPQTLSSRMRRVAEAIGLDIADYQESLGVLSLRGKLCRLFELQTYFEALKAKYDLIILDALYRFLESGDDENSNAGMTAVYNRLDQIAAVTEAAVAIVHHMSKGPQDGKAVSDLGAGAGAQSRAADCHLGLRPDRALGVDMLCVESIVRSFPPLDAFWIRREWPLWVADSTVTTSNNNKRAAISPEGFAAACADTRPRTKKEIVARAIDAGMTRRPAEATLESAITDGHLHPWKIAGEAHKRYATRPQPTNEDADDPPPF